MAEEIAWPMDKLTAVTQGALDKTFVEGDIMTAWEPEKWNTIKTLAAAAAGEGTVELMSSQEHSDRHVAVKRLPWDLMRSSPKEFKMQYPKETEQPWTDIAIVKHLNSIRFPYVLELLGVYRDSYEVNIVSSFANRGNLFAWVQNDTTEAGEARETAMRPIVTQMLKGVEHLHALGIAHRDLSTENVMLHDAGDSGLQVKIIDFAMATLSRKVRREVRGKRSYQAPEMHCVLKYDTFLADNFALGVIVYCMAVHYYPWDHTKPGKDRSCDFARNYGMKKFLRKKRMPCSEKTIAEVVSESYSELVCGLLDFDPEMRHSLGEACFHQPTVKQFDSEPSWLSDESDALSEISTACSSLDSLPPLSYASGSLDSLPPVSEVDDNSSDDQVRIAVWDCRWLL